MTGEHRTKTIHHRAQAVQMVRVVVAAAAIVLVIAGCTEGRNDRDVVPGASTGAPTQAAPQVQGPNDEDADLETPAPYPTWDAASKIAAQEAARSGLVLYAKPTLSPAAWWRGLRPRLTSAAAEAYIGTDPANIPVHAVRGPARLGATTSPYLADVAVRTDVGTYRVLLSRAGQDQPWLIERFTPPASLGGP